VTPAKRRIKGSRCHNPMSAKPRHSQFHVRVSKSKTPNKLERSPSTRPKRVLPNVPIMLGKDAVSVFQTSEYRICRVWGVLGVHKGRAGLSPNRASSSAHQTAAVARTDLQCTGGFCQRQRYSCRHGGFVELRPSKSDDSNRHRWNCLYCSNVDRSIRNATVLPRHHEERAADCERLTTPRTPGSFYCQRANAEVVSHGTRTRPFRRNSDRLGRTYSGQPATGHTGGGMHSRRTRLGFARMASIFA